MGSALARMSPAAAAENHIEHIAVCHPSRRGYTNEKNATEIAEAIARLGFRGVDKNTGTQDDR